MKTIKKYPPRKILLETFIYEDGKIFWRQNKGKNITSGKEAGRVSNKGYFRVCINRKEYLRSRIIYIMHNGDIPFGLLIDHKNEIKHDDRIDNLRLSNNSQNKNNSGKRKTNKSGYKGVSWKSANNKYQSQILVNGQVKYLGLFNTPEDAHKAYSMAAKKYHGVFAHY